MPAAIPITTPTRPTATCSAAKVTVAWRGVHPIAASVATERARSATRAATSVATTVAEMSSRNTVKNDRTTWLVRVSARASARRFCQL